MDAKQLQIILDSHLKWLTKTNSGIRADLSGADLREANLNEADLSRANLSGANLREANLSRVNLHEADLSGADLRKADLRWVDLCGADLCRADLRGANLSEANLHEANLREANLCGADLSGADLRGANLREANLSRADLLNPVTWLRENFKNVDEGIIVWKALGETTYPIPDYWIIAPGKYLEEVVNPMRTHDCACGVSFGTLDWIKENYKHNIVTGTVQMWKCLITWMDLASIVVPYNTDGKARCGRLKLLEIIEATNDV